MLAYTLFFDQPLEELYMKMKAYLRQRYGGPEVFELAQVEIPQPKPNEIRVRIAYSSINSAAVLLRKGVHPDSAFFTFVIRLVFGFPRPRRKIIGYEFSGVVDAIGAQVKKYKKGDAVYGTCTGLKQGAYADYVCVPEEWRLGIVRHKPAHLSFAEAAALPIGGMTAACLFSKLNAKAGESIVVYGASGSVGSYAVQLAQAAGLQVTAICSTASFPMMMDLGIDNCIDYRSAEFAQLQNKYDYVFDAVKKLPAKQLKALLKPGGKMVSVGTPTSESHQWLEQLEALYAASKLRIYIEKIFSFSELRSGHEHADTGHKKGNLVMKHD